MGPGSSVLCFCALLSVVSAGFCDEAGWELTWADEFTTLDTSSWNVLNGTTQNDSSLVATRARGRPQRQAPVWERVARHRRRCTRRRLRNRASLHLSLIILHPPHRCRDAMCLSSNVAVRDGQLVLTARREDRGWAKFTTGAVNSQNKRSFAAAADKPIRVCIAGSLPGSVATGKGLWPAFWLCVREFLFPLSVALQLPSFRDLTPPPLLLPDSMPNTDACWPDNGELDLMEEINGDGVEHYTYHVSPRNATKCHGGPVQEHAWGEVTLGPSMASGVHEYAVEIALGQFSFVVDGVYRFHSNSTNLPVHDVPWYVILNLAIGGPWPKPPDGDTVFPVTTTIDYVRVSTTR